MHLYLQTYVVGTHVKVRAIQISTNDIMFLININQKKIHNPSLTLPLLESRCRQHSFVKIDHEIFSTVILSLPLIQEGQLSVSGERMCTILVNRLED